MKNKPEAEKAREYAFLLLKYRQRSSEEMRGRLKNKGFSAVVIRNTVNFLEAKRFLDDREFTRAWIDSRFKKSLGLRRIRQELRLKGVDKEVIEKQAKRACQGYAESEIVREIAEKRLEGLKRLEPAKARERLYSYLIRRGFSPETVVDTINTLCRQTF